MADPIVKSSIVALLTCHNRREKTLACLRALGVAGRNAGIDVKAVLVDDGSTDGTGSAASETFEWVTVLKGNGSLFWCGGMRMAMDHAVANVGTCWYLWLNDDTVLHEDALRYFKDAIDGSRAEGPHTIFVGATRSADGLSITYGGYRRKGLLGHSFELVIPTGKWAEACTMNGNVVLLHREVIRRVGNIDPAFIHAIGDFDYGLRARQAGIRIIATPAPVATCDRNSVAGSYQDPGLPLRRRLQLICGIKALPPSLWRVFSQRHGGVFWPLMYLRPYLKTVGSHLVSKICTGIRQ